MAMAWSAPCRRAAAPLRSRSSGTPCGARLSSTGPPDRSASIPGRALRTHDTEHPAHAVAIDRERQGLLPDHEADASGFSRSSHANHLQEFPFAPASGAKDRFERARAGEPVAAATPEHRRSATANQGASRARPFARRAERTLRPPTLFIRARKPCVRLRLTTEGWNVRFMVVGLNVKKPYIRAR